MPLPTVAIVLDLLDAGGTPITAGSAVFTPTSRVLTGPHELPPAPVTVGLGSGPSPVSAAICPSDLPGAIPTGWAWQVAFNGVPGNLRPFTFLAPAGPVSFTAATGTPGVVTWTATSALTSLPNGTGVQLSGTSLPGGVAAGVTYYVTGAAGQALSLATSGGSPIAFTTGGSGTLTVASYNLAALTPVTALPALTPLMPTPAGIPVAGQVPVASGTGQFSAWGSPGGGADLDSPAFTGTPTAPTAPLGDDSSTLATTAYVDTAVESAASDVTSVFGRTGPVTAQAGDYTAAQVTGALQVGGDLGGTPLTPVVARIQGTALAMPTGSATDFLNGSGSWSVPSGGGGGSGMTNPMTTPGDLVVGGTAGAPGRLGAGTSGFVLTAHGSGTAPTWAAAAGGGGGGASIWNDLVETFGADNTGVTSIATPLASAVAAAVAVDPAPYGLTVPPGIFKITQHQDLPRNLVMQCAGGIGGSVALVENGTIFKVASTFSTSGGSYVFGFKNNSDHSTANGALLSNCVIDGTSYTAAQVHGIQVTGPAMTKLQNIQIVQMSGWGVMTGLDTSAAEIGPYGQVYDFVTVDSCLQGGFQLTFCEDSYFRNCYAIGNNNGDGFQIAGCDNSKFIGCNSEWNAGNGWHITNTTISGTAYDWTYATGGCQFIGCNTDANAMNGVLIDGTWQTGQGAGTGPCTMVFSGCFNRRDGKGNAGATGTYAGFSVGATNLPIIVGASGQCTGIGDGGGGSIGPRYGYYFTQSSYSQPIIISGSTAWGYSAAVLKPITAGWPTGVTTSAVVLCHGDSDAPVYGS